MVKVQLSREELENQLFRQVKRLKKTCNRFDQGDEDEIEEIGRILRLLLHETRHSKALLKQTGAMDRLLFADTASPFSEESITSYHGLVSISFGASELASYEAPLDTESEPQWLPFEEWWRATVFRRQDGKEYSRKAIVLTFVDQDGVAHVDPELDEDYHSLTRQNAMKNFTSMGGRRLDAHGWASPRRHQADCS